MVLLRLQPYRQQTVQHRVSQKLSKRYFGPYKVIRRIGKVAYELDLPPSSRIHPVVHVSQLRAYYGGDPSSHFSSLPPKLEDCVILDKEDHDSSHGVTTDLVVTDSKVLLEEDEKEGSKLVGESSLNLEQEKSSGIDIVTGVLDMPLDITAGPLLQRNYSEPLDRAVDSQIPSLPLDDKLLSTKQIPSPDQAPRVTRSPPLISHAATTSPLIPANGPPPLIQISRASQRQLDASVSKAVTGSTMPGSNTPLPFLDPHSTSSPPSITTTRASINKSPPFPALTTSTTIPNLEDKVLSGPDSDVSGPSYPKPKRKTFKPFWNNDFVPK